jgi:hypothetical protein
LGALELAFGGAFGSAEGADDSPAFKLGGSGAEGSGPAFAAQPATTMTHGNERSIGGKG